jgi:hypothetical protein
VGKRPKDLNSVLFLIGVQELGTREEGVQQGGKAGFDAYWNMPSAESIRIL